MTFEEMLASLQTQDILRALDKRITALEETTTRPEPAPLALPAVEAEEGDK